MLQINTNVSRETFKQFWVSVGYTNSKTRCGFSYGFKTISEVENFVASLGKVEDVYIESCGWYVGVKGDDPVEANGLWGKLNVKLGLIYL